MRAIHATRRLAASTCLGARTASPKLTSLAPSDVQPEIYSLCYRNPEGLLADDLLCEHAHGARGGSEPKRIKTEPNQGWPIPAEVSSVDYKCGAGLVSRGAVSGVAWQRPRCGTIETQSAPCTNGRWRTGYRMSCSRSRVSACTTCELGPRARSGC